MCINVGGGNINSDAYLNFSSIPRGCSVTIALYKIGYEELAEPGPCVKGYLGNLPVSIMSVGPGTYFNETCVNWNGGGICAPSPYEHV